MKDLTDAEKWKLLAKTDPTQAASEFSDKTGEKAAEIAEELGVAYIVNVALQLGTDAAAELLRSLPDAFREKILHELPYDKAEALKEVLSYAAGTAGALMAKEFLSIPVESTIGEVTHYLQSLPRDKKGRISYIYVVDKNQRLEGVIQVRDLIFHSADKTVREVLKSPVVQVETGMSQLDVARLLQKHRYLGLPVVNDKQKLVGVISADTALEVFKAEAEDDIAKIIGTSAEELKTHSVKKILGFRLPWLFVSIASGLFCAFITDFFQQNIRAVITLFLFIPVVLGLSESTGVQGATIVVRNMALGLAKWKDMGALFLREAAVGVIIGMICGSIVGLAALFWQGSFLIGTALAFSLSITISGSALIGLLLPLIFKKFKIDPAMASGPLVLALCDIQALCVYFLVSGLILSR